MKKITSLLLVCVMAFSLSVSATAWTVPDTAIEVPQSNGMTYEQINAELSGDAAYDWSNAVSISGDANDSGYEGNAEFKITHAGDYIYIYTKVPTIYDYRTQSEEFIYVDLIAGDGVVDYTIIMKPNYGPYTLNGSNVSYYQEGVVDRARQNDKWGPAYNNTVNKDSGLATGVLFGRNEYSAKDSEECIYHVAVPLSEANKEALANGSCNIGVGYAFIQCKTAGAVRYYTNCGSFTIDHETNCGNDFYEDITEEKLTTLTLKKGSGTLTPDHVIENSNNHVTEENLAEKVTAWVEADRNRTYDINLEDLTVNIIGDSYFAGHTMGSDFVWPKLLAEKYYWKFNNYGKNGGMVSTYAPGVDSEPMVTRYQSMADNNANLILVNGGRNDYNNEVPLGSVDSTDTNTYMGALNVLIDGLQAKYPKAVIMCTTVWNYGGTNDIGLTSSDYANAMIAVCEAQGVYCFKANDPTVSGVDMTSESFRSTYCLTATDISHLNVDGMKLVMPKFEAFITASYADYLEKNPVQVPTVTPGTDTNETTTGDTETDTDPVSTSEPAEAEGGCASSLGFSGFAMMAAVASAAILGKKRKNKK